MVAREPSWTPRRAQGDMYSRHFNRVAVPPAPAYEQEIAATAAPVDGEAPPPMNGFAQLAAYLRALDEEPALVDEAGYFDWWRAKRMEDFGEAFFGALYQKHPVCSICATALEKKEARARSAAEGPMRNAGGAWHGDAHRLPYVRRQLSPVPVAMGSVCGAHCLPSAGPLSSSAPPRRRATSAPAAAPDCLAFFPLPGYHSGCRVAPHSQRHLLLSYLSLCTRALVHLRARTCYLSAEAAERCAGGDRFLRLSTALVRRAVLLFGPPLCR
ncbi:hypothetical protein CUR178_06631 [Leishmania enriettii]|uniref:Uncharacterized protein n=1 Tax=Leishmania enriettii TaxID=5663 RepID=A0A836HPQ2_LEIEN|nr:hypothetical protein CUR178_06631 [Leishmania enriettii]